MPYKRAKSLRAANTVIDNFAPLANLYVTLKSNKYVSEYEYEFFEKILPLKEITNSQGIILYWVDNQSNSIKWKQSDICPNREKINIPIGPNGHVAGATAYNKGEYLIQDIEIFSRRYTSMTIDEDRPKTSVLFYPILSSKREVLAIIEIFRNNLEMIYTTSDYNYVAIVLKWIGLSLEQANELLKQKNEQEINQALSKVLVNYFSKKVDFLSFIDTALKMIKDTVLADKMLFYDVNQIDRVNFKMEMYIENYENTIHTKASLIWFKAITQYPDQETYLTEVLTNQKIINKRVTKNDSKINSDIKSYCSDEIKSILYIPFIFNKQLNGVAVLLNIKFQKNKERNACSESQLSLLNKICYYLGPGFNFRKLSKVLIEEKLEYEKWKEVFINSLLEKSMLTDEIENINDVGTTFSTFQYNPGSNTDYISLTYYIFFNSTDFFKENTLKKFILIAKKGHLEKKFHNFYTTFIYLHTMYVIFKKISKDSNCYDLDEIEKAALLTVCLYIGVHNLGYSDAVLRKINHPISILYGTKSQKKFSLDILKFATKESNFISHRTEDEQNKFLDLITHLFVNYTKVLEDKLEYKLNKILDNNEFNFSNDDHKKLILVLILFCNQKSRSIQLPQISADLNKRLIEERNEIKIELNKFKSTYSTLIKNNTNNIEYIEKYEIPLIENVDLPHYRLLVRIYPILNEIIEMAEKYRSDLVFQIEIEGKRVWFPNESRGINYTFELEEKIDED